MDLLNELPLALSNYLVLKKFINKTSEASSFISTVTVEITPTDHTTPHPQENVDGALLVYPSDKVQIASVVQNSWKIAEDWISFSLYALNKPRNVECTLQDGSKLQNLILRSGTVDPQNIPWNLGRLDKNTTGLLMFTNSGLLTDLYCCKGTLTKTYSVRVDSSGKKVQIPTIISNVMADERTKPHSVTFDREEWVVCPKAPAGGRWEYIFRIVITSGEFHIVRRLFASAGVNVKRLERSEIGSSKLQEVVPVEGEFKECSEELRRRVFDDVGGAGAFAAWRICLLRCAYRRKKDERLGKCLASLGVDLSTEICFQEFPRHTCPCLRILALDLKRKAESEAER
ncbi:hypothetical protein CYMTET_5783 [Cymbomonas tetramitiformis]|uniref:Pseudouridine synthase RsuA/RluA-like domain-containing protein n=1 Tax=Cymbomonas tetramitiformis TaxID=36881 RepID=A0AAE0GYD8_9CHLO|nr:hypothetical protein CYMTET_5783 [Cymbomonas tetramitiformis]|eukprot:gene3814-4767_t